MSFVNRTRKPTAAGVTEDSAKRGLPMTPGPEPLFNPDRCAELVAEAGIDLLLASTRVNVAYLSGCMTHVWNWDYPFAFEMDQGYDRSLDYLMFAGVPADSSHHPFLVANYHAVDSWRAKTWIDDIRGAGRQGTVTRPGLDSISIEPAKAASHVECAVSAVQERGLEARTIGVELRRMPQSLFAEFQSRLPKANFVDAHGLLERLRAVKSPLEVARIRRAYEINAVVFEDVFYRALRPEGTVHEAFLEASTRIYREGGSLLFSHFFFGSGHTRTSADSEPPAYNYPPHKRLRRGDMGSIDFGVAYGGYFSDVNRSVLVGAEPTARQRAIHEAVVEARDAIRQKVEPGVRARDLYAIGAAVLDRHNLCPALSQMGHGIGLKIHEPPWLQPDSPDVLQVGMVVSIEPVVEAAGVGLVSIEDAVLVTESGFEPLCGLSTDLRVLG